MIILATVTAAANQVDGEAGDQTEEDQTGDDVVGAGDVKIRKDRAGVRQLGGGLVVEGEGVLTEDVIVLVISDNEAGIFAFGGVVVRHWQFYGDFAGLRVNIIAINHNRDFVPCFVHKYRVAVFVIDLDLTVVKLVGRVNSNDGVAVLVGAGVVNRGGLVGEGDRIFVDGAAHANRGGFEDKITVAILFKVECELIFPVRVGRLVGGEVNGLNLTVGVGIDELELKTLSIAVAHGNCGLAVRNLVAIGRTEDFNAGIVGKYGYHDINVTAAFGRSAGRGETIGKSGHQPHEDQTD